MNPSIVSTMMSEAFTHSINAGIEGEQTAPSTPVPVPYLPPKAENDKPYTIVLDLDETLIHYNEEKNYLIRPG